MSEHQPYVPAAKSLRDFTFRAALAGVIFCAIFGSANAYLGLKVGQELIPILGQKPDLVLECQERSLFGARRVIPITGQNPSEVTFKGVQRRIEPRDGVYVVQVHHGLSHHVRPPRPSPSRSAKALVPHVDQSAAGTSADSMFKRKRAADKPLLTTPCAKFDSRVRPMICHKPL